MVPLRLETGLLICRECAANLYQCDECGEYFDGRRPTATSAEEPHYDFCPHCGSHLIFEAEL